MNKEQLQQNIPIYRAKKIDGDKWVEGNLSHSNDMKQVFITQNSVFSGIKHAVIPQFAWNIDPTTLSIQFNKDDVFYALENYKGGDLIEAEFMDNTPFKGVAMFNGYQSFYDKNDDFAIRAKLKNIKVIGIQ